MFLTEWICTLGFQQVPIEYSILHFEGLILAGWEYLFEVILKVYFFLFPWFRKDDMGHTIMKLKNYQEMTQRLIHKYKIDWKNLLSSAIAKFQKN